MRRHLLAAAVAAAIAITGSPTVAAATPVDTAFERQAAGDTAGAQAALDQLPAPQAQRVTAVMMDVNQALSFPLTAQVPAGIAPGSVIVILGHGLLPDGGVRPILIERMRKGLAVAQTYPTMPIVVSGGAPKAGRTEAAAMRDWLVGQGLHPSRIHLEDRSGSTSGNAILSTALIRSRGLGSGVVLVTSANHLRRSVADFLTAGNTLQAVVASDAESQPVPDQTEIRAIFADARSVAGI